MKSEPVKGNIAVFPIVHGAAIRWARWVVPRTAVQWVHVRPIPLPAETQLQ